MIVPVASRLAIAFGVGFVSGGKIQFNPSVPLLVMGEPVTVKSDEGADNATLVTVPLPVDCVAHTHAVPFHFSIWFVVQVESNPRFSVPLVPPPVRPLPEAVVIPVMVPWPVPGNVWPVANVI